MIGRLENGLIRLAKQLIEFKKTVQNRARQVSKFISFGALTFLVILVDANADQNDIYFCQTDMFVAFPIGENPIRYDNEDFEFEWKNDDTIAFNEDSLFKGALAPITYSSIELFDARLEFSTISYSNGSFNYAQTLYQTITVIQATCKK